MRCSPELKYGHRATHDRAQIRLFGIRSFRSCSVFSSGKGRPREEEFEGLGEDKLRFIRGYANI